MENRIAAYVYLFVAGVASATLGFVMLLGPSAVIRMHPDREDLEFIGLAGAAAIIAAAMVHAPFVRAARACNRMRVYAWTLGGVVASHLAYAALVFVANVLLRGTSGDAGAIALFAGLFSFMLGFLQNLLAGTALAEILMWREKLRRAAPPRADAASSLAP